MFFLEKRLILDYPAMYLGKFRLLTLPLKRDICMYISTCPSSKLVLTGYIKGCHDNKAPERTISLYTFWYYPTSIPGLSFSHIIRPRGSVCICETRPYADNLPTHPMYLLLRITGRVNPPPPRALPGWRGMEGWEVAGGGSRGLFNSIPIYQCRRGL